MKSFEEIKISTMSGKLKGIKAINTNTTSNPFCQKMRKVKGTICNICFSDRMLRTFRKSCVPAFEHNSKLLFNLIPVNQLPTINQAYFRFSAHGELVSYDHFVNLINICVKNPHCKFTLWSKKIDIVNLFVKRNTLPDNLILVYSSPKQDIIRKKPKNFDKVFTGHSVESAKQNKTKINCSGACLECLLCYKKNKTVYVNELIK